MTRRFDRPLESDWQNPVARKRFYDKFLTALEGALDTIDTQITDLSDVQAAILALQADMLTRITEIEAAQAAADAAQTDANAVTLANSISASWVSGLSLSGADAGSDASATISNHTRYYDDGSSVAIIGATLTALAFSTEYHIYYDDPTRADTTPSFQSTTDPATAAANRASGRHYVGSVTTPADGGADTTAEGPQPPGWRGTGTL